MYELTIISDFSAAHRLMGYEGECENLHGHNWKVEVSVRVKELDNIGLAIDFKTLKFELEKVVEKLDHKYLNEIPPFDRENPSSENIARFIFNELAKSLNSSSIMVSKVKVWESERAAAAYYE
ncbi:MAG: 6-carboxytetrahydropterin synthase QueD [Deltaproteobacteria bacterium GWC2_42_11]|nr:MAG: 6-carboxytetrahydropterin synthase QueD [Deltaproteobacteria bacterium GWC2_42_11]HBO83554.1 6-carboxytetrahydropterin synthase QueD [Deltaproteobacteria bacterium]